MMRPICADADYDAWACRLALLGPGSVPRGNLAPSPTAEESDDAAARARYREDGLQGKERCQLGLQGPGVGRPGQHDSTLAQKGRTANDGGQVTDGAGRRRLVEGFIELLGPFLQNLGVRDRDPDGVAEERGPPATWLEQRHGQVGPSDGQRDPGQAGPRADVYKSSAMRN